MLVFAIVIEFPNRTFKLRQYARLFIQFDVVLSHFQWLRESCQQQTIHLHILRATSSNFKGMDYFLDCVYMLFRFIASQPKTARLPVTLFVASVWIRC